MLLTITRTYLKKCLNFIRLIIYRFDIAFPLVHIFLNPTLSFINRIGREVKIPNAMRAKESVVNLAMPHSDEVKAIIDNCMEIPI